mgnify:CR=1 FL=1
MKEKTKTIYLIIIIFVILVCSIFTSNNSEIQSIKSEGQLLRFYEHNEYNDFNLFEKILMLPFSVFIDNYTYKYETNSWKSTTDGSRYTAIEDTAATSKGNDTKDYSKTNIQVEDVDEADIVKTDGDYIYSLSENSVVITDVKDPENIKVMSKIYDGIPVDLIIYKNKLVVISTNENVSYGKNNTLVSVYSLKNKENPKLLKSFELHEPYYTTRCIDGKLYVFSSGSLRMSNIDTMKKVDRTYKEDGSINTLKLSDIKYLKDSSSNVQTLIAEVDLNDLDKKLKLNSYLIDISNAYVSENNIYLLDYSYNDNDPKPLDIFGFKGIIGLFESQDYSYKKNTQIYKFKIDKKLGVLYSTNKEVEGTIVNQYSLDEKDGNLRIALDGEEGTRVAILDKNLSLLGETASVAKDEIMYSSRFVGDKAYLVTYKNTDPLFVMDLSDVKNPKVMGELKIPGYSTYLHPYDENHLIGIGMDTEERINRDDDGKVINSWAVITGMKMSLFDVSDISNPKQISNTTIGDSRTVSAILTNPKALLFSKEKELLAIPVNNYSEDFSVADSEDIDEQINDFAYYNKDYVSEGYFVYNINLDEGFKLKGIINHEKTINDYYRYYDSRLLRGLYIDDNLFTVSKDAIKVHNIADLKQISELKLKGEN